MELVPGFVQLLQPLASTMTTPTFDSLITVLTGWVFARRRTVTQMILAAGSSADKHYSSYHRVRGIKLPTPQEMLTERCRRVSLDIYGRTEEARVACCEARMHAAPNCPLRIVAVEALAGGRGQEAFYSTCYDASAEEVIAWYAQRWSIEVAFHDSKQHLGFEQPQGWSRKAVERTAPLAMLLYSLIVLWFAKQGHRLYQPLDCPCPLTENCRRSPSRRSPTCSLR